MNLSTVTLFHSQCVTAVSCFAVQEELDIAFTVELQPNQVLSEPAAWGWSTLAAYVQGSVESVNRDVPAVLHNAG